MKRIPLFALSLVMGTTQAFSPVTSFVDDTSTAATIITFAQLYSLLNKEILMKIYPLIDEILSFPWEVSWRRLVPCPHHAQPTPLAVVSF